MIVAFHIVVLFFAFLSAFQLLSPTPDFLLLPLLVLLQGLHASGQAADFLGIVLVLLITSLQYLEQLRVVGGLRKVHMMAALQKRLIK